MEKMEIHLLYYRGEKTIESKINHKQKDLTKMKNTSERINTDKMKQRMESAIWKIR